MPRSVELPPDFLAWLNANVPGIGDAQRIRFLRCGRIPLWWIPGGVSGITLWNRVLLPGLPEPADFSARSVIALVFHELVHVRQFRRHPLLFPLRYLVNHLRYGYENNPAEIEARRETSRLLQLYFGHE